MSLATTDCTVADWLPLLAVLLRMRRWGQESDRPRRWERGGGDSHQLDLVSLGFAGLPADAQLEDCSLTRFYSGVLQLDTRTGSWKITLQAHDDQYGDFGYEDDGRMETDEASNTVWFDSDDLGLDLPGLGGRRRSQDHVRLVLQRRARRAAGVRPMMAPTRALVLGFALALAGCGKGNDMTAPIDGPPVMDPGPPQQGQGVQGSYVLEQINGSKPGQLVTISNPDGTVIGLYRFEATTLTLDALQTFELSLRFTDDKSPTGIDDGGEFKQAGPVNDGALPLAFSSAIYGDSFLGVVLQDMVAIKYDFDGDGQADTSFGFRRQS